MSCVLPLQGKKNYSLYLPSAITSMALLRLRRARVTSALIVGLANGEVRIYNEKALVRGRVVPILSFVVRTPPAT